VVLAQGGCLPFTMIAMDSPSEDSPSESGPAHTSMQAVADELPMNAG
jgi:hypothetical protein